MRHHIQTLKEKISEHRKELFIVFLIFMLAFGTRAYLMKYELPFEFDPYWHARMVSYIVQDGSVPDFDPMAYYYNHAAQATDKGSPLYWYAAAGLYKIVNPFGPYSKDSLVLVMKLIPALYGAFAAAALYFLVKEIYGKKAGIIAAVLAAVIPAFVYRTMAGFFEPTSSGFLWVVLGLYFLVKASKNTDNFRKGIMFAVISGAMLALMALSWKGFTFTYLFLIPIGLFTFLTILSKEKKIRESINYLIFWAVSIGIMSITGWIIVQDRVFLGIFDSLSGIASNIFGAQAGGIVILGLFAAAIAIVAGLLLYVKNAGFDDSSKKIAYFRIALLYVFLVGFFVVVLSGVNLSTTGINASIGEESRGVDFFGNKYNALLILPLLALVLIPLKDFMDKDDRGSITIFFMALATLALAWIKLKFTFLFGLPAAASVGVIAWFAFDYIKEKKQKMLLAGILGLFLLVGIAAGSFFVTQNTPNIEMDDGWKETLKWASVNTPKDAKFFNWWNQGHWITFVGERTVLIDNRNAEGKGRSDSARFFSTDNQEIALSIIKKYDSDYVIADDDLLAQQSGLVSFALEYNKDANEVKDKTFFAVAMPCSKTTAAVSGGESYNCGGNVNSAQQMAQIPAKWQETPNNFLDSRTPIFVYRAPDNSKIYILSMATNSTVLAKMWFGEDSIMQSFEEVHSLKSVKVFKVKAG